MRHHVFWIVLLSAAGCDRQDPKVAQQGTAQASVLAGEPIQKTLAATDPPIRFVEVCEDLGIGFRHYSGMTEQRLYPTSLGSGVAVCDFDQDGRQDIYLVTANDLSVATSPDEYRNSFQRQLGDGTFADASRQTKSDFTGYGLGVAASDFDNDGFPDIFLGTYGPSILCRNNGDGTFSDLTAGSGFDDGPHWTCCGVWFDADQDGDLDLYATTYSDWEPNPELTLSADLSMGRPMYRSTRSVKPAAHLYYRNQGDSTFRSSTVAAGFTRMDGRGLGVVAADVNRDGHIDLYVANDMCPNFLYLGRGDGTFADVSETSGAAYNGAGRAEAGMGVDAEDVNGDVWPELFVTNFSREQSTLLANNTGGSFQDVSTQSGVVWAGLPYVKWGTALLDLDLDTWPDIFVTNGQVDDNIYDLGELVPYRQPPLVWRNRGGGKFDNVSATAGPFFRQRWSGRAMAFGDLDNDGDFDLVLNNKDDRPAVLLNQRLSPGRSRPNAAWIRFCWSGVSSNRAGIGAAVEYEAGGRTAWRQSKGGMSYMASSDARLLIGLGDAAQADFTLRWPSGVTQALHGLPLRRTYLVREGSPPVELPDDTQ